MFKSFQMLSLLEYSVWGSNINEDNNIQPAVYVTEYIPSHMIGHNCLLEKLIHQSSILIPGNLLQLIQDRHPDVHVPEVPRTHPDQMPEAA